MKRIYIILCCSIISIYQVSAQQTLRRFLQPATVVNNIPYGNNPSAGHYAQSGDAKIYYEVYGKGEPFVLLHGGIFGSTIEMAMFIDSLSKYYQVIAISTRGHGKSENGKEPLTLEQRSNDVIAVIKQVTKEKVTVLGFSDGGYTTYQLASKYPNQVKKIIVIGAGILYPGLRNFHFSVEQAIKMDTAYWQQQFSLMPEPKRLGDVFQQIENCYSKLTVSNELLGSIKCPTLLIAGDRDEGNTVENVLKASIMIPNHQLAIIPNAGHVVFLDNFLAVWNCIVPFLKN